MTTLKYREAHREELNEKAKDYYRRHRETILERNKLNRVDCPHCGLDFNKACLANHIARRHDPSKKRPRKNIECTMSKESV